MNRDMEHYLILHCSPTLASLKAANMFRFSYASEEELMGYVSVWNERLSEKGVHLLVLHKEKNAALIYVFREALLRKTLEKAEVEAFMARYQYPRGCVMDAIHRLQERFLESHTFPHEIGLFLGYPLGDVTGFIENAGKNCLCSGYWKVYCNACETMKRFEAFNQCRMAYMNLFQNGSSVMQLTVAA